ncbi:hypothetical protein GCM10022236_44320 [Microlunatus ginsengisoli]|uniref:Uncharacterized protein n=2 Tax=Microlunatus ginsengisoli TaxID=363863 RepID=A0ABP7ANG3_9ACTN
MGVLTTSQAAAATYGVPTGTPLTDYNPPSTSGVVVLPDGFVGDRLRFHGVITFAGSARITRSLFRGPAQPMSGQQACVRCYNRRVGQAVLDQCTIRPQLPFNCLDGILGWQYEVYRSEITGTIDGAGIYATAQTGSSSARVVIEDTWIHDLTYYYPDLVTPSHADGTHPDCIEIQGGRDITLRRLKLEATATAIAGSGANPAKPWLLGQGWANGNCVVMVNNTGIPIRNLMIDSCTLRGGLAQLAVKPDIGLTLNANRHYRAVAQQPGAHAGYWIRFDDLKTDQVQGLGTSTWIDGPYAGQVLTQPRDRGIHTDRS